MYKLYTFFDGCNASVLPLQHFTFVLKQIVLTTMKRMLNRMLCSIRFVANAENIRTKEQKSVKTYGHGLASMCPQEQKGYAVKTLNVINKRAIALNATA